MFSEAAWPDLQR